VKLSAFELMAAVRLTAVWKTSLRRPSSFVRFCTTKSGDEGNETADGGSSVTSESEPYRNSFMRYVGLLWKLTFNLSPLFSNFNRLFNKECSKHER
jgi:hypothetical protein